MRVVAEESWRCRRCAMSVRTLGAFSVSHRCPGWRNRWVDFERFEEEEGR